MNVMSPLAGVEVDDPQPFKLRIEDYELLDRAGAFYGKKVELIGGRIVEVNAQLQAHIVVKNRLGRRLQGALEALGSTLEALVEGSVALSPHDLPDPDILIATVTPVHGYIQVEQVAIVIEVSNSSLRHDLGEKRELYAVSGVPEYWVVDVNDRRIHQFWAVGTGRYIEERIVPLNGPIVSATIPDLAIEGSGIL